MTSSDNLEIIYQDNHLLVVNKPAGLLTQPSPDEERSAETLAKRQIGRPFLEAVHRLDRPVSGVVVFAKTSKALKRLQAAVRERRYTKVYHAWVEGKMPQNEGTLIHNLVHLDRRAAVAPEGKRAELTYKVLERRGDRSLVEIHPLTGRYHQIRCQLAEVGCPIVGDGKYGAEPQSTILLKHVRCTLPHPISGEMTTFAL
jgi:23S rRNA pseudouridine1911/1915/1917 synthase